MQNRRKDTTWKDLLPQSYNWIQSVKIESKGQVDGSGLTAVFVSKNESDAKGYQFESCNLDNGMIDSVKAATQALGWSLEAGATFLNTEAGAVALIPAKSLDTTVAQKSRQAGLDLAKMVKSLEVASLNICATSSMNHADILLGLFQGYYVSHGFKGTPKESHAFPETINMIGTSLSDDEVLQTKAMAKSLSVARQLQDAPPNYLDSILFGEVAEQVGKDLNVKCTLHGREEIQKMGMGAFNSVAAGTPIDPRLITFEIEGEDTSKTVALVGKGLTFDAGGISIKPSAGMAEMKYDMSGGSAVLGAAMYFGQVKPPVNVICVIGAVENMPGVSATRPGDVVRAMNGKTVEILNTDAEGRLVLADALHYAVSEFKVDAVLDIATLTGAVLHGLGTAGSAVMGNDDVVQRFLQTAKACGEPFWQLPMWPELSKEVKSEVADLKNIAGPSTKAGTIMGAVFLKEFVGKTPWAHLDIAGTGWNCKATGYPSSGGSAFGVLSMVEFCKAFGK